MWKPIFGVFVKLLIPRVLIHCFVFASQREQDYRLYIPNFYSCFENLKLEYEFKICLSYVLKCFLCIFSHSDYIRSSFSVPQCQILVNCYWKLFESSLFFIWYKESFISIFNVCFSLKLIENFQIVFLTIQKAFYSKICLVHFLLFTIWDISWMAL